MKKRIVSLAMAACLVLSMMVTLSACGGKPTLEEYYNSDAMQTIITAPVSQYEAQGVECSVTASGDELRYDFTIDIQTTEEERAIYAETLESQMPADYQEFIDEAKSIKESVSNETVTVVVTYYDADANVLYTQSYSSDG